MQIYNGMCGILNLKYHNKTEYENTKKNQNIFFKEQIYL